MSDIAIKAEDVGKLYRLGQIGTGTISHDLNRWWAKVRGKEDPFSKVGEVNDRTTKGDSEYVWALKDINFEIKQGEAVGIIGRNGAGKSTLLKLLSKVTKPTTGEIGIKGRIASLLEVGTGFHPEMTGRENIYLNGAILGMTKKEITRKFDEIVDFSGVERYVDTPVKRYSSGMYVRLAFAVAAHLESEILIVDEVLAVGDAEFQKKCLGKMGDVSKGEGRTVLFVSHNMASIQNLCSSAYYLENGKMLISGSVEQIINVYLSKNISISQKLSNVKERKGNGDIIIVDGCVEGVETNEINSVESFAKFKIKVHYKVINYVDIKKFKIDIGINNNIGDRVAWMSSEMAKNSLTNFSEKNEIEFIIKANPLAPGNYNCNLYLEVNNDISDWLMNVLPFDVIEKDYFQTGKIIPANQGNILLDYNVI